MARIRSIKPEFWTSEQVMECSLNARLLFIGMWNFADDLGRLPLSVKTIKASVFPGDDIALDIVRGMIDELSANGLVLRYVVDDREYLQITGWQHQRIDKPQPGKCPSPVNGYSKTIPGTIPPDRKGEDRKGKDTIPETNVSGGAVAQPEKKSEERKARKKAGRPIPDDFEISPNNLAYAKSFSFSDSDIKREHQKFRMHHKAKGTIFADWNAAEHNWITKAADFAGKRPRGEVETNDDGLIEVLDHDQLEAWDAYGRETRGKPYPRDKFGGWRFPSKWPPGYETKILEGVEQLVARLDS